MRAIAQTPNEETPYECFESRLDVVATDNPDPGRTPDAQAVTAAHSEFRSTVCDVQRRLEVRREIRQVKEPSSLPVFQSVRRIWHFPNGDVLLELAENRDCLIPDVERVDVPVTGVDHVAGAVALDTNTTVRVTDEPDGRVVNKIDKNMIVR